MAADPVPPSDATLGFFFQDLKADMREGFKGLRDELGAMRGELATKADKADLAALEARVNAKADVADVVAIRVDVEVLKKGAAERDSADKVRKEERSRLIDARRWAIGTGAGVAWALFTALVAHYLH